MATICEFIARLFFRYGEWCGSTPSNHGTFEPSVPDAIKTKYGTVEFSSKQEDNDK